VITRSCHPSALHLLVELSCTGVRLTVTTAGIVARGLLLAVSGVVLVACGATTEPPAVRDSPADPPSALVAGFVYASPSCPVESVTDPCLPRRLAGATVELYQSGDVVATDRTDARGHFRLTAPPGPAVILVHTMSELGSDSRRRVKVRSDGTTKISVGVDVGLR